jgi:acetaldehyde dehydrogenase (acetylating)
VRTRAIDAKDGYLIAWGDAKLVPARPTTNDQRPTTNARSQEPGTPAPVWAVDPAGIESLAKALKRGLTTRAAGVKGAVVLAEFRGIDLPVANASRVFTEELATALIRQGVPLVERGQLEAAMQAMKLTPETTLSPATVKELGRRSGAALLIVGTLADRVETVVANARILRTDTGAAVWAERAELLRSR